MFVAAVLSTRFSSLSTGILTMTPLRQRFIEDHQLRNRSPKTIEVCVYHVCELARHHKQSPERLGDDQVRCFLVHLLHGKQVSWSFYNQAIAALRFVYQRPDNELDVQRLTIAPFKRGQENRPLLLRSCFPHHLALVQRLTLARWFSGCAIRQ